MKRSSRKTDAYFDSLSKSYEQLEKAGKTLNQVCRTWNRAQTSEGITADVVSFQVESGRVCHSQIGHGCKVKKLTLKRIYLIPNSGGEWLSRTW